jgi:hypothetical protein
MIAEEAGGNKQYRNTRSAEPAKVNKDEEFRHISDELHRGRGQRRERCRYRPGD